MAVSVADEQDRPVDVEDLAGLARHVLAARDLDGDMELTLLLVDRERIAELNEEHMGVEGPTDVLAFPIDRPGEVPAGVPGVLGDVVLCPEVAAEQAGGGPAAASGGGAGGDGGTGHADGVQRELQLLTVHGILHLLGMDHAGEEERREMFALTDRLLAGHREGRHSRASR